MTSGTCCTAVRNVLYADIWRIVLTQAVFIVHIQALLSLLTPSSGVPLLL